MTITVEDGSGVTNANSYISLVDAQAYATARGLSVTLAESHLIRAMDFIEAYRAEFQGVKTDPDYSLQWPRYGAVVDGFEVESDEIPALLPAAQAQLAADAYTRDLMPVSEGREVVSESVEGAVSVTYGQNGDASAQPIFTAAKALLAPLLKSALSGGSLWTVRV